RRSNRARAQTAARSSAETSARAGEGGLCRTRRQRLSRYRQGEHLGSAKQTATTHRHDHRYRKKTIGNDTSQLASGLFANPNCCPLLGAHFLQGKAFTRARVTSCAATNCRASG